MKKFLMMLVALVGFGFAASAGGNGEGQGSGSCKVEGTGNGYVQATAYLSEDGKNISGNIVIANSSNKTLMTAYIICKAKVKYGYPVREKWVTLYDGNWNGTVYPDTSYKIDVSEYVSDPWSGIVDVTVKISNPVCN